MSDTVEIRREGGLFALDPSNPRTIRGLLLPFGEEARNHASVAADGSTSSGSGDVYKAGDVEIPRDPSVATLNRDHDRFDPIGRALELNELQDGVHAAFLVAETDEGDAYLEEYANGQRRSLSAEIARYVNAAGETVRRVLTGAAVVPEGAFASAHLYSLVVPEAEPEQVQTAPPTTDPAPAETDTTGETPAITEEDTMADAVAPVTLGTGAAPAVVGVESITKGDLFAALVANQTQGTPLPEKYARAGELFALGAASGNQGDVFPVQMLGELWDGAPFVQKFAPLVSHGDLSSISLKGWKITTKPTVATWTGDGAAVSGTAIDVTPYTANATRKAGGNTFPREYYDFGETQFVESSLQLQTDAYKRAVDAAVEDALIAGATALASSATTIFGLIIDGALAIVAAEDVPAFALVNPADFAVIANTKEVDKLAYVEITIDWGGGNMGGLIVVPSSDITAANALTASKNALKLYELPGSPIRVNAQAVATGSVDEAVFGYFATLVHKSTSIQLAS